MGPDCGKALAIQPRRDLYEAPDVNQRDGKSDVDGADTNLRINGMRHDFGMACGLLLHEN